MLQDKMPLSRALITIFLSTVMVSGSAALGLLYYQNVKDLRARDPKYNIIAVVQTSPTKEGLKTEYLAELLDLSLDQPTNLYNFSIQKANHILMSYPVVKKAKVKKIPPSTIYVDYSLRQPVALLGDYTNTAIDSKGYLFPFKPFFRGRLPEIYLGMQAFHGWGSQEAGAEVQLAFDLLNFASAQQICFHRIDVSRAFAPSYGQREIVVEEADRTLRLSTKTYKEELLHYSRLKAHLAEAKGGIVDLRIPNLAFYTGCEEKKNLL